MRFLSSLLLVTVLGSACSSPRKNAVHSDVSGLQELGSDPAPPIDPEALGFIPKDTPAVSLHNKARAAFDSVFNRELPSSFVFLQEPTIGWFSKDGTLKQIRTGAHIRREEFRARFPARGWKEIPIPAEYYGPMHLPRGAPKDYMTCFVGRAVDRPAYLLWSDYAEVAALVVDY
jgi:hypothetical protein